MTFKEIVELISKIDKSQISLLELNYDNFHLKLDKSNIRDRVVFDKNTEKNTTVVSNVDSENNNLTFNTTNDKDLQINVESTESDDENIQYITSPMVGTIYLASAPGKKEYVSEGQSIKKGDVVCIVEAMKLMNEIESEISGDVVEILVKNAQMVEFGQKLFKIKTVKG